MNPIETSPSSDKCPLLLTPAARDKIIELGGTLVIHLEPGGCCGTTFVFARALEHHDLSFAFEGLTLGMEPALLTLLGGSSKLDYGAKLVPPRFRILRLHPTLERCACNRSFGQPFPGKVTPQCRAYTAMPWDEPGTR